MKPILQLGRVFFCSVLIFSGAIPPGARAADANPPLSRLTLDKTTNGSLRLTFPLYPAAQRYDFSSSVNVTNLLPDTNAGKPYGLPWIITNGAPTGFYKLTVTPMPSNDLFSATVLNRLTYGPTPDDIDHIRAVGPQQFITEQLAAEIITDTLNIDPPITNTPPATPPPNPLTNWIHVAVTGTSGGNTMGFYLNGAGSVYLDNVWLVYGNIAETGSNLVANGDFETTPIVPWSAGSSVPA